MQDIQSQPDTTFTLNHLSFRVPGRTLLHPLVGAVATLACGAMALPIVGLISFLVGVIMAYQGAVQLRQFGADIYLADMVGVSVVREMGALMAAIVLAGRTGAAFAGCGLIGVVYAVILGFCMRDVPRSTAGRHDEGRGPDRSAALVWLGYILLLLCFVLSSWPGWAVKNWLPTLLQDRFLLSQKASGLWATMANAGASFLGVLLGGRLSDRWVGGSTHGRTWVSALGLALTIPAILGIGMAPSLPLVILCTLLFGLGFGMFDVNNMPILCQLAPARVRATAYGFMNFFGIAAGGFLTPILGGLKDKGVPLAVGFAYCAVPSLVAVLMLLSIRPKARDRG